MKQLTQIIPALLLSSLSIPASAQLIDFNDQANLGVTLGGDMKWSSIGGGHLYNETTLSDDVIFFLDSDTYVNSFEMNAKAWEGFSNVNENIGKIDIAGLNVASEIIWQETIDLSSYSTWDNWLTINVETAGISQLSFYAPALLPNANAFWPSIDNLVIDEAPIAVPVPHSIALFASGWLSLFGFTRRRNA